MKNRMSPFTSSCKQTSKTVTLKLQLTDWFAASVAVMVTVVVPSGKLEPDGFDATTVTAQAGSTITGAG